MKTSLTTFRHNSILEVLLSVTIIMLLVPGTNHAQQQRGFHPGGGYSISDIEMISQSNGNMMLQIPLASLPAGRGGVPGFQVKLNYNSKLYDTVAETITDPGTQDEVNVTFLTPSQHGGWHYNFDSYYRLELESRTNIEGSYPCECNANFAKNAYIWKLKLIFPDGGEHVLRPIGFNDFFQDGYFAVDPNGVLNQASCGSLGTDPPAFGCNFNTTQATTAGMTYYSTDGTFVRLFIPYASNGGWGSNWTLSFNDGRRLITTNGAKVMLDRNNNEIPFGLSDELSRSITVQKSAQPNEDHITMTGPNGIEVRWIVKWKSIWISRPYISTVASSGRERGNSYPQRMEYEERVVDEIILPSQAGSLKYTFGYSASADDPYPGNSPGWGELNSITLPTGAQVHYDWAFDDGDDILFGTNPKWDWVLHNRPVRKDVTYLREYDGASTPTTETWMYSKPTINGGGFSSTGPDGSRTVTASFKPTSNGPFAGLPFKIEHPDGSVSENIWAENRPPGVPDLPTGVNPYIQTELTSIRNANGDLIKTAIKDYKYDKNGNVLRVDEYDWIPYSNVERDTLGLPKPLSQWAWQGFSSYLKKTTSNTYYNPTPTATDSTTGSGNIYLSLSAPLLRTALKDTEITLGATKFSRVEYSYDDANQKGNVTEQRAWNSEKGAYSNPLTPSNSSVTTTQYNQFGSPILTVDPKLIKTRMVYGTIGTVADLYPTEINTAFETSVQRTEKREYNFETGLVTKVTDWDNSVSTSTQYDDLGRPILVRAAANTPDETQTATQYFDSERRVVVRSDLHATGDGLLASVEHYDQLGRVRLTRQLEVAPTTNNLADEEIGIKVQTRYFVVNPCAPDFVPGCITDNLSSMASYALTSKPYRAITSDAAASEPTMGWSRAKTNNLGRVVEVQTFSGSDLPAPWASNNSSSGILATAYDGPFTVTTDEASRVRRTSVDGLGRVVRVDEPSDNNNTLGSPDSPTQETTYEYDPLGNLTGITQGTQHRTLVYTSLSRLRDSISPESGTLHYEYDDNGNLKKRRDERLVGGSSTQVEINYAYDELNRVTLRSYNDGTPNVTFTYDQVDFSKGRLTSITSSVSAFSYTEFDKMGRVKECKQTTDGQVYSMNYTYNAAGAVLTQSYPSGKIVANSYDAAGRVAGVKNNATQAYYAGGDATDQTNRIQYFPRGPVQKMKLGNTLWQHYDFNSKLQMTQIGVGTTASNSSLLKLDYTYGVMVGSTLDTSRNNGNIRSQVTTLPNTAPIVQNFEYDELNRLKKAEEVGASGWIEEFTYDRFANRTGVVITDLPSVRLNSQAPEVDPATNRLKVLNAQSQPTGYAYDPIGNLTQEVVSGPSVYNKYQYDAESRLIQAKRKEGSVETDISTYSYDGNGNRVKTIVGGATTVYVYDLSGKLIAEYSSEPANAGVSYLTSDLMGNVRLSTGSTGQVKERHDYLPFGEEIPAVYSGRAAVDGYGENGVRQKFTGKERDDETGLDYFTARFYQSKHGRFLSIDPEVPELTDPQAFNKYQYCFNNPTRYRDPDGKYGKEVHYDLTRILAIAAGFSDREATLIAKNNQLSDEDPNKSPAAVKDMLPFGFPVDKRRLWHFTTAERRNEMWSKFEGAVDAGNPESTILMRLGEYFHAQQDSYSHAGYGPSVGQVPSAIYDENGNIELKSPARVDETDYSPDKANRMAKNTFEQLLKAAGKMKIKGKTVSWERIAPLVDKFVRAKTNQERARALYELTLYIQDQARAEDIRWRGCLGGAGGKSIFGE